MLRVNALPFHIKCVIILSIIVDPRINETLQIGEVGKPRQRREAFRGSVKCLFNSKLYYNAALLGRLSKRLQP